MQEERPSEVSAAASSYATWSFIVQALVNSAGDWGKSDPLAVPEFMLEMRRRGHAEEVIRKVVYDNPLAFFSQSAPA